jgi:Cu/Ag efflux pump CusA
VGGLTSSTILSLFLVPVIFMMLAKRPEPEHEEEHALTGAQPAHA